MSPRGARGRRSLLLLAAGVAWAAVTAAAGPSLPDARDPRDGRGWVLRAYDHVDKERYSEAAAAFEKGVAASRKVAADPGVLCDWADALAMAQGGTLAGRPTEIIRRALALKASHPKALEMAGSAAYERRDFAAAVRHWQQLLPQLTEGSLPRRALQAAIERARRLADTDLPRRP